MPEASGMDAGRALSSVSAKALSSWQAHENLSAAQKVIAGMPSLKNKVLKKYL
jgi:hypothetical protein